jgi:hypothetical protein
MDKMQKLDRYRNSIVMHPVALCSAVLKKIEDLRTQPMSIMLKVFEIPKKTQFVIFCLCTPLNLYADKCFEFSSL